MKPSESDSLAVGRPSPPFPYQVIYEIYWEAVLKSDEGTPIDDAQSAPTLSAQCTPSSSCRVSAQLALMQAYTKVNWSTRGRSISSASARMPAAVSNRLSSWTSSSCLGCPLKGLQSVLA